ncbi:MAG TPA: two-component regulator propeller domain-containing protein [Catalimonadaceae bacterium]|nr:two-component regulator propeller domain-containing protein [Catalimonadaceae bacterium]
MTHRFILLLILIAGTTLSGLAQIPIGSWRMHLPYNNAIGLARMGSKIYTGTTSGIFIYDTDDQSIVVLNKINGLSDIGITAMAKHPAQDVIMVGYENGNLDLLVNGNLTNLPDIINSSIIGSKRINKIKFSGSFAYLATDFGMVVYNYKMKEIKESNLLLGPGGLTAMGVTDCAKLNDTIYALTKNDGLKSIRVQQDFKNTLLWKTYSDGYGLPLANNLYQTIDSLNNTIIITQENGIHVKIGNRFDRHKDWGTKVRNVRATGNRLLVCAENTVLETDLDGDSILDILDQEYYKKLSRPSDVIYDPDGTKWVSDLDNGLLKITPTDTIQILPNGPLFNGSFALHAYKNELALMAGGYIYPAAGNDTKNQSGFAIFSDNSWSTYNRATTNQKMPVSKDISRAFFNPFEQNLYLSSFGLGIVVKNEDNYTLLNDRNTDGGLCNVYYQNDCVWDVSDSLAGGASDGVRISSAIVDQLGELWVTNFEAPTGAVRKRNSADNSWTPFVLPYANGGYALDLVADQSNFKWVRMAPGRQNGNAGIWVLNSDGSKKIPLNNQSTQGGLPSNDVFDIKEDKSGYIWVGTSKGLAVYYNPYNAFFTGGITASLPIFPPEAGRPVLENDVVTAIEVDGANRKWVGTQTNGIWLFNADITKVIAHFDVNNSPLISNFIYDIAIQKSTGEVFIATDKGLISYQSDASENIDNLGRSTGDQCDESKIEVFPNPVKKGYDGTIAIRGLASNSEVKFVTASGKLVYKTTAKGGTATWNGKTYDGEQAHPGIYLVLSSTEDGKANCVSKLAILN